MSDEMSGLLRAATEALQSAVKSTKNFREYVARYESFYYKYALDGHEGPVFSSPEVAARMAGVVEVHRRVQEEVLNQLVDPEVAALNPQTYAAAGRLSVEDALFVLKQLLIESNVRAVMQSTWNDCIE